MAKRLADMKSNPWIYQKPFDGVYEKSTKLSPRDVCNPAVCCRYWVQ